MRDRHGKNEKTPRAMCFRTGKSESENGQAMELRVRAESVVWKLAWMARSREGWNWRVDMGMWRSWRAAEASESRRRRRSGCEASMSR